MTISSSLREHSRNGLKLFSAFFQRFKALPVAELYLYIIVLLYPILPSYFVVFGARVSTILAVVCLLLLFSAPQLYNLRLTSIKIVVFSTIFLCLLFSAISNQEVFTSGFLSEFCNYIVIPFYCAVLIDSKEKFDRCASILIGSAAVLCLFSLTELFFSFNVFSLIETVDLGAVGSGSGPRFGIYRVESSFGQAIAFGIYLSFISCLTFYKLYKKENQTNFRQNVFLLSLLIFNFFIFLSGSRFPLIVVLLADIVLFFKLSKRSKIKVGIFIGILIVGISIVAIIKGTSIFTSLFESIISIFKGDAEKYQEDSSWYRMALYNYAKKVVGPDIFFGRGLHVNTTFIIISPYYGLFQSSSFDNGYIYLFLQQGIVGLIAWFALCYSVMASGILSYEKGFNDHINLPVLALVGVCLLNMLSVARLDESRAFMIIIGCYLGLDFHLYKFEETSGKARHKKIKMESNA